MCAVNVKVMANAQTIALVSTMHVSTHASANVEAMQSVKLDDTWPCVNVHKALTEMLWFHVVNRAAIQLPDTTRRNKPLPEFTERNFFYHIQIQHNFNKANLFLLCVQSRRINHTIQQQTKREKKMQTPKTVYNFIMRVAHLFVLIDF